MAKLTLADIGAGFGLTTTYNDNSALIEAAIENTLSRDGTGPNQMEANLDMNSFRVINLEDGIDPQDAVTVFQLEQAAFGGLAFPLRGPDGSAVAPTYSFLNDTGAGMFLNAVGEVGFAANGVEIARAIEGATDQFAVAPGSGSLPGLTSLNDLDTGFVWTGSNQVVWMGGGSEAWNFTTGRFFSEFSGGPSLENTTAQDDVPTVLPNQGDSNTGLGSGGSDELSGIAGGVEIWRAIEDAGDDQFIVMPGVISLSQTKPALAFDDGNTGFFQAQANSIDVTLGSSPQFSFFGGQFKTWIGGGGGIVNVQTTTTIPSILASNGDTDNGLGYDNLFVDNMTLIAGGVSGLRIRELFSHIIQTNENHTGLTADPSQTQVGGLALLSSYNEVATVATTGDSLTAFTVKAGDRLVIVNNGANNLQLFPAVGEDIGAGVDTAIVITAGEVGIFLGRTIGTWDILYNDAPGGGVTSGGTAADNEIAVFTGPNAVEGNDNFLWDGSVLSTFDAGTTDGLSQGHDGLKYNFSFNNSNSVDFFGSTSSYQFDRSIAVVPSVGGQSVSVFDPTGSAVTAAMLATGITQSGAGVGTFALAGMTEVSVPTLKVSDYTFPGSDGTVGQVLTTDGAGAISFTNPGAGGLLSGQYRFSTSIVAADPGSGLFRYNSATPASVTEIFIDDLTSNGIDISNILSLITTDDRLYIQSEADSAAFIVFNVTAPVTDNTGWFTITGTVEASGTLHGSNVRTLFVLQIGGAQSNVLALLDLTDVNSSTPTNRNVLVADGIDWESRALVEADISDLQAYLLTEVNDLTAAVTWANIPDGNVPESAVTQHVAAIDHDLLLNFAANEHFTQAAISITESQISDLQAYLTAVPDPLLLSFGSAGAPTYSFASDPDTGFFRFNTNTIGVALGGSTKFLFTGGANGTFNGQVANGPTLRNIGSTATVPNIGPSTSDSNTGIGWAGADMLSLIGGGLELMRLAVGGVDVNAGMRVAGDFNITNANGAEMPAEASTATNPTLVPNRADSDTGIGGIAGVLSLIQNGVESAQGATPAAGGLLVNNTLTGPGLERVLTLADLPGAGAVDNDVAQARRTTGLVLTTAFVDVTLDTTDVETDAAVVNHDLATNTDNIIVGVTGTYKITYNMDIEVSTTGEATITAEARVRINDTGVGIPGSDALTGSFSDGSIPGDFMQNHLSQTFYVNLTASDFVTLQLEKVEISGTDTFTATRTLFTVERVQ